MTFTVGYIPYLNMVPFHFDFGPRPMDIKQHRILFRSLSPRTLGIEAQQGKVDAGAMSLVDCLRLSKEFEPLANYGIGVKHAAKSVLLFSRGPLSELRGTCAVTDETSTSVRLLQILLDKRYGLHDVRFGRIASSMLFDGSADALLLIGDEALQAAKEGIRGLPVVTDLGSEWFAWQGTPFTFARWVVRRSAPLSFKLILEDKLENSLRTTESNMEIRAYEEGKAHGFASTEVLDYWQAFDFRLSSTHQESIGLFQKLIQTQCLTV